MSLTYYLLCTINPLPEAHWLAPADREALEAGRSIPGSGDGSIELSRCDPASIPSGVRALFAAESAWSMRGDGPSSGEWDEAFETLASLAKLGRGTLYLEDGSVAFEGRPRPPAPDAEPEPWARELAPDTQDIFVFVQRTLPPRDVLRRARLSSLAKRMGENWNGSHIGCVGIVTIPRGSFPNEARIAGVDPTAFSMCVRFTFSDRSELFEQQMQLALMAASALARAVNGRGFVRQQSTGRVVPLPQ